MALLEVRDVTKSYGGLDAVDGVSFSLEGSSVLGLIGPNGSGKTTLLGIVSGTQPPTRGEVALSDTVISGKGPHRAVHAGVARTFQTTRLFATWTLRESMRLASYEGGGGSESGATVDGVSDLLRLSHLIDRPCQSLTSAQQRLAMIAIALSTGPRVLLLDEPAVGTDPDEASALADTVRRISSELGVAVIVVDHNMHFLMPLADSVLVMAEGRLLATGTPAEVRANEDVIASYLGS